MTSIARPKGENLWDYCEFNPYYVSKVSSQFGIRTTSFGNKIDADGIKKHRDICSDELGQLMATWGVIFDFKQQQDCSPTRFCYVRREGISFKFDSSYLWKLWKVSV